MFSKENTAPKNSNNVVFVLIQDSTEDKIPMCVIGNKVDLREQLPEGSCVSSLHGEKLAKVCNLSFHPIETCLYRHPASQVSK